MTLGCHSIDNLVRNFIGWQNYQQSGKGWLNCLMFLMTCISHPDPLYGRKLLYSVLHIFSWLCRPSV